MKYTLYLLFLLISCSLLAQHGRIVGKVLDGETSKALAKVSILLGQSNELIETDQKGDFTIENLNDGKFVLTFFLTDYTTLLQEVTVAEQKAINVEIKLEKLALDLEAVEVTAKAVSMGLRQLCDVEGTALYAAKKTEVIELDNLTANAATNNPRQVYKGIAGLNIWENDGAGLQLSIGARGLDPNRTSNFNTRQNGYDISADALGYPESYYTPPTQALKRIEVVRGAASLQYGPQFGGLLNFVFKKGNEKKAFEFESVNTVGSFGLLATFNSISGSKKNWRYYTFYQRKQGKGWRPNSDFYQNTAYASVSKKVGKKIDLGIEYTFMNYLSQQSGGLQDFEFAQNAQQSKRERNWFNVNWNLLAVHGDYTINDELKINSRSFLLMARREALGDLSAINRPDPLRERDLIKGAYQNFGNETRLIKRYNLNDLPSTFLIGTRYYQGFTTNQQGLANDGYEADFTFLNPDDLERSQYEFPSRNFSIFAENLFNISPQWSITPGIRLEHIRTASDGYYKEQVYSGGQVIFEQKFEDAKANNRSFALLGTGVSYKPLENIEAYSNFSQNYRPINFSDLAVVNPNLIVDSLLQDEEGFNVDLGIRGTIKDAIRFDVSGFLLQYKNRIGVGEIIIPDPAVIEKAIAFRTNIGDARIVGLEAYAEANLWKLLAKDTKKFNISIFTNFSLLQGIYTSGQSTFKGNNVELIPPFSLKMGINFQWKNLKAAYQYAYVAEHFSDATNAIFVVDATRGLIPAYSVQDLSLSYTISRFNIQTGINNLLDAHYFTRRATAYPGPGIIPADGRSFYLTLGVTF